MGNQKLTFEVNAKDVNIDQVRKKIEGIDKEILALQEHAKNIRLSNKGNTDIGKDLVKGIESAINELKSIKQSYETIVTDIGNKKIDTKQFDDFVNSVNSRMETVEQRVTNLEESLTKLASRMDKKLPTKALESQINGFKQELDNFVGSAKDAIEILKTFEQMVSSSPAKPKEIIDTSQLKEVEEICNRLNNENILGGKSGLKLNTASATKQLTALHDKYQDLSKELSDTKDPKQISKLESEMAQLLPEMAQLANRIIELKKLNLDDLYKGLGQDVSIGKLGNFADFFEFLDNEIGKTSIKFGKLRDEMKDSVEKAATEATTEVSQFTFKNGGIRVPITIDAKSKTALETKYNQIVGALQEYADVHPVNVTMRLFPLNTNRTSAKEITNSLRRIQTDINSVEDEELRVKLNSLYDDLESQFKKALDLKIKVDLGDTQQSVLARIRDLRDAIKQEGFTVYPEFKISKAEAKNIGKALKEIQKQGTLDLNKQFNDTLKSMQKLLTSANGEKWAAQFAGGLETVYEKLEKIQPFIESLATFFVKAKLSKNDLISGNDVKNIINLSNSIKTLKESIEKIETLDLSKTNIDDFGSKIQNNINDSNPILIPIEPDLSGINSFIDKIENALNNTGINLKITNAILPKRESGSLRDTLQDKDNANKLYLDIYKNLDAVAENIGSPLKKKIAESLVAGLRNGLSDTSQMLRDGLKGTQFESITEQIIGNKESLNTIKNVANNSVIAFQKSLNTSNVEPIQEATKAIEQEGNIAKKAAEQKREFSEANKQVAESAEKTADTTKEAANGIAQEENVIDKNNLSSGATTLPQQEQEVVEKAEEAGQAVDNLDRKIDETFAKKLSGTVLVDDLGRLVTLYHATNEEFDKFDVSKGKNNTYGSGAYFGFTKEGLEQYGSNITEWFGNVKNIFRANTELSKHDLEALWKEYSSEITEIFGYSEFSLEEFIDEADKILSGRLLHRSTGAMGMVDFLKEINGLRTGKYDSTPILQQLGYDALDNGSGYFNIFNPDQIIKSTNALEDFIDTKTEAIQTDAKAQRELAEAKKETSKQSDETPVSTEYTESETKALLSKKEVVEQLRAELNLTKKVAEDLFDQQGYTKTNNRYQIEQQAVDELITSLKEKKQIENQDVDNYTKESTDLTNKEAQAMTNLDSEASKAAESKKEFVEANQQVLSSIIESLKGLNSEGEGFSNLNKLINNLGEKNGEKKVTQTVEGLKQIYEVLNQDINDNALINSLNELASKGTDLQNLATVLKATKTQITNAKKATVNDSQDNLNKIMGSVDVGENAKNFLGRYGEVVNLTQEVKNGFIQIKSTVLDANNEFKKYTLTTTNGIDMAIAKQEEHTTGLEKEVLLYAKLLKASQNLNKVSPNHTDEVFIEKDSDLWNDIIMYAEQYGEDLGNILSITRSVRQVNDELLESFKIVGENGSVTIGAENDVVGSIQNIGNITKEYRELGNVLKSLQNISEDNKYTDTYLEQVRNMINLIQSSEFNLTNPDDVVRLQKIITEATELKQAAKDTDNILGNTNSLEKIRQKISDILNDYQAMPRSLKGQFEELREQTKHLIDTGATKKQVDEVNAQFLTLNANLSESGKKYQGMIAQMFQRLRSESSQLLARYFSFQDILRYSRSAFNTIRELDTSLVDLRKTTSMNVSELNEFYRASTEVGKQLGVTSQQIIQQAADWSRLGYSTKEQATTMAELSSKFASISPGMTTENSTDYLVSTMKAFGIETDKVERQILDNVNRIGNTFATTNAEIGEMLTRSSAAMNAANNSLEETIALEAAAVQVTRNAETTGTAFRTVSMRIRGKQSMPPYGENYMLCA